MRDIYFKLLLPRREFMLKTKKSGLVAKLLIIVSTLLLASSLILGTIMINNSQSGMKELMRGRLLDIVKTASSMIDGDTLKNLTAEDKGTKPYQAIYDALTLYQKNISLKYIYCVRDLGNKNFIYMIDPDPESPANFGDPIVYSDALYEASKGNISVDDKPTIDQWGKYYSAFAPVYDSEKKIVGIVGVDFPADWFEEQLAKQTNAIIFNAAFTVLFGILLMLFIIGSMKKHMVRIIGDLSDTAKDVEELQREINPATSLEKSDNNNNNNNKIDLDEIHDVQSLGRKINKVKNGIKQYILKLHSQANSMITALSSEYRSVYYVDLDKNEGVCYMQNTKFKDSLKDGERFSYTETVTSYANQYVTEKYRDEFLRFIDLNNIRKELEAEKVITFRYMVLRDGQKSYEMIRIAGVYHPKDNEENVVHAIGLGLSDVDTETRRSLEHSQTLSNALSVAETASKAKTAFLSNMSHEIRTPMNAIIGLDKIALNDPTISGKTRDYLEKIGTSAEHLLKIINDILDMSRIEAGRMALRRESFSLTELLDQVKVMIGCQCNDKGLNLEFEKLGETDEYYIGDAMKLKQVLINILGNSVKFTPKGGTIRFTVESSVKYDRNCVFKFVISDTGIGMSKDYLPKLFEPFSQEDYLTKSKYGSTGLGMSITKSIVEMMNGNIQVESEKDKGTTFTVTVTLTELEKKVEEYKFNPKELNILIVDDDSVACEYAKIELEKVGIASDIVTSGKKAIEMVTTKHARMEAYNLIIVDWKMPDMDGLEITKKIRSITGTISKIFILTSFDWNDIIEDSRKAGVDGIISKPLQTEDIIRLLKHTLSLETDKNKAELKGRHVMLAEDMDVNAEIIQMILKMREITVERVENGKIAVDLFSSQPANHFDAILMDMRMPEMGGLEATKRIRSLDRDDAKSIPIIALTANAFDEDVQQSLQAGLNAHLSKPVEPESLFETLENLIKP